MALDEIRDINKFNDDFSKTHKPSIKFPDMPSRDANMVIACMDPRSNPNEFWGISESNPRMAVVRNAGGRVTEDVLRSIRVVGGIMGYGTRTVRAVAVVHHKDCGMTHFRNEKIGHLLSEHAGLDGEKAKEAEKLDYGEITDVEASVWEDMKRIRDDPYLPKDLGIIGYVYDGATGKTTEVGTV